MIEIKDVCFQYENSQAGTLHHVNLTVKQGECVLLCGESGCGKTTLTRLVNGLIPHYYPGKLTGSVTVKGKEVTKAELYETARDVGSVFQNPRSQFFCVDTTSEIAFGCENMGLPVTEIQDRVQTAAEELHIRELLGRNIFELSGGEKQKVACASVAAVHPEVFVLDEPTSNLDVDSIEELKKTLQLWKEQGKTILLAEHRLYWLLDLCDRVVYMKNGKVEKEMPMELFQCLPPEETILMGLRTLSMEGLSCPALPPPQEGSLQLQNFSYHYGKKEALEIPELSLPLGGVIAVIGHNGAGKSTFSRCLCGLTKGFQGTLWMDGEKYRKKQMLKKSYMVMQDVNHQLFCETVLDEARLGMAKENAGDVEEILQGLDLMDFSQRHPMSLSGGQKQRVAIASAVLADKEILVFDEPTSGLDFRRMEQTAKLLSSLQNRRTTLIVTHDPELIIRCCTHILHLENGHCVENYPLSADTKNQFLAFFS